MGIHLSPRYVGRLSPLLTNLVMIQLEDGSAVRIEHINPRVKAGQEVKAGDRLGFSSGYLGEPHIHFYSMNLIDDEVPNKPIIFSNVPNGKRNKIYEAYSMALNETFPGMSLAEMRTEIEKYPILQFYVNWKVGNRLSLETLPLDNRRLRMGLRERLAVLLFENMPHIVGDNIGRLEIETFRINSHPTNYYKP